MRKHLPTKRVKRNCAIKHIRPRTVIPTYYYTKKLSDAFRKCDKSVLVIIYSKTRQSRTINYLR